MRRCWRRGRSLFVMCGGSSGTRRGVSQPLHLQSSRRFNQRAEVILKDVDFATIHILQKLLHVTRLDIFQEDNRMRLVTVGSFSGENVTEKGRTYTQHELVSLENNGLT